MLFVALFSVLLSCLTTLAAEIPVKVGTADGGLNFDPETVVATANDSVVFTFLARHAVTQSTINKPCSRKPGGFDSDEKDAGATYTVKVHDTNTVWIFCDLPGHCENGMVFAINPPTSGNETFDNFKARAEGKSVTTTTSSTFLPTSGTLNTTSTGITSTTRTNATSPTSPSASTNAPHSTTRSTAAPTTTRGGANKRYPDGLVSLLATSSAIFATAVAIGLTSFTYSIFA